MQKGDLVAVILERGIPQITAIYGILLAGGCYVPVSYHQPDMRLKKIFDTLQIGFAVTDDSHQKNWEHVHCLTYENAKNSSAGYLPPELSADDSAYIIMTSGSTGTPKGVEIQAWQCYEYDLGHQSSNFCFCRVWHSGCFCDRLRSFRVRHFRNVICRRYTLCSDTAKCKRCRYMVKPHYRASYFVVEQCTGIV